MAAGLLDFKQQRSRLDSPVSSKGQSAHLRRRLGPRPPNSQGRLHMGHSYKAVVASRRERDCPASPATVMARLLRCRCPPMGTAHASVGHRGLLCLNLPHSHYTCSAQRVVRQCGRPALASSSGAQNLNFLSLPPAFSAALRFCAAAFAATMSARGRGVVRSLVQSPSKSKPGGTSRTADKCSSDRVHYGTQIPAAAASGTQPTRAAACT